MRDPKILAVSLADRGRHPCRPDIELIEASLTIRELVRALEEARNWLSEISESGLAMEPTEIDMLLRDIDAALLPNGKETPAHEYICFVDGRRNKECHNNVASAR